MARDLIVRTGVSVRGAAGVLAVLAEGWHLPWPTPSGSTIRSWLLRLGCYALCCPLPQHIPWVWLVDHTIQIGTTKLLVILGCPLADVPFGERPLALADLRLLALVPMQQSTATQVEAELEKATARTGVPRLLASDHGNDLKKGIANFQQRHADTAHVYDVAHYGANILENRWQRQPLWGEFLRQLQQVNQKLRQSDQAHLLAPTLRTKARFMNVGPLLRFASRVLRLLTQATPPERVVEKYGWLLKYRETLAGWLEEHRLVHTTIAQVRQHGVNAETEAALKEVWGELSARPGTQMVAGHLRVYARQYSRQAKAGETLVGSTEILESSFGKLKRLAGEQSGGGFTSIVLALGALLGNPDAAAVQTALEEVPRKEAEGWLKRTLGATVRWLRRQVLGKDPA